MKTLYTASATTHGGRQGHVESSDGVLDLALSAPEEMGGGGGYATNPEQLFAAGYAACFESALRNVASQRDKSLENASITANVGIGKTSGGFGLEVELIGYMSHLTDAEAEELMHAAHELCPYSNATRGNIDVQLTVA